MVKRLWYQSLLAMAYDFFFLSHEFKFGIKIQKVKLQQKNLLVSIQKGAGKKTLSVFVTESFLKVGLYKQTVKCETNSIFTVSFLGTILISFVVIISVFLLFSLLFLLRRRWL